MNIEKYIKEAGENVNYDCGYCNGHGRLPITPSGELPHDHDRDCNRCNGTGKTPPNISDMLCDVIEALMDARRAHKKGEFATWSYYDVCKISIEKITFENWIKGTYEDHLTDAFIRLFELCGYLEIKPEDYPHSTYCPEDATEGLLDIAGMAYSFKSENNHPWRSIVIKDIFDHMEFFCDHHNIPIEKHIEAKLKYNRANK